MRSRAVGNTYFQTAVEVPPEFIFQRELHVVQQVACITPHLFRDPRNLLIREQSQDVDVMAPNHVQIQLETRLLLEPCSEIDPCSKWIQIAGFQSTTTHLQVARETDAFCVLVD